MGDAIRPVRLPDGTEVWVRASNLPRLGGQDDYDDLYEDVGLWENVVTRVEGLKETVEGVARSVRTATAAVAPDETAVTFGIEVSAKPGKAVAVLADGEAKANLSITLTWHHADRRAARRAAADTDAGPAPVPGPAPGNGAEEGDSRAGA